MQKTLVLAFLFFSLKTFSQSDDEYWAKWNKNYPEVKISNILKREKLYADSVERHPDIAPYYFRIAKYSFRAEFLGRTRPIDTAVLHSMKRVYTLSIGDPSDLDQLTASEALFKIGNEEYWMPIQPNILKAALKEIAKGDKPKLYCLYLNEHTSKNKLYNTFLISEFMP